jgi:hypothetical protein
MSQVAGRRLTYAQLTGKQVDSLPPSGGRDGARRNLLTLVTAGWLAAFNRFLLGLFL